MAADRDLLFGLLALQNGLIDQGQLVAAFQAWTRDKARPLADHLVARGDLDADDRAAVEALVAQHLKKHGGDAEKSLAAIPAGRSTRESLARLGDPELDGTARPPRLGLDPGRRRRRPHRQLRRRHGHQPTASGSASSGPTPGAAWAPSSWPSTRELNREVALKQILDHHADDPTSRQRFLLEAEITGGLEHPGIVPVYGLGTYGDGRPYYAMRFIRGDSLKEAIDRFHADEALKTRPRPAVAGAAQAAAAVPRRLQRDRLRPQPGRAAPRHQAGQHHRRQVRRDAGGRLGPGQGRWAGPSRRPTGRADAGAQLGQRQRRDAARAAPWARRPT